MKNYKAIYFFALLAFMVIGCDEETPETYQETSSAIVDDSKLFFNLDNFDDPVGAVKGNVEVQWDEYSTQIIEGQEWQEYKIKELRPRTYSQDSTGTYIGLEKGYNYTLLATKSNGRPEFYLAKMVSYSHPEERSFFSLEENNFHGLVYLYNMIGAPAYIMHYEKGEVLNKIENLEVAQEVKQLSDTMATARCIQKANTVAKCPTVMDCSIDSCGGGGVSGTGWVTVTTYHFTEWYNKRPDGRLEYNGRTDQGVTQEVIWVVGTTSAPPVRGLYTYATQSAGTVSYSGSQPKNVVANTNLEFAPPSCESFDYYKVGNTGTQVAGVDGIWDVVTKWDRCPGIGVAASYQTYYFQVPARWNTAYAAEKSADALANAFFDLQEWFKKQKCGQIMTGVLAAKMDEFIKENFKEIGGQATRNAPLGWRGVSREYKEDWTGTDRCM